MEKLACVRKSRWASFVIFLAWMDTLQGVRLSGCSPTNTIDVPEESPLARLTCLDTGATVTWYITASIAATCDSTVCSVRQGYPHSSSLLATRPNSSSSELYVRMIPFRNEVPRMECLVGPEQSVSCFLRTVYTETPASCRFDVMKRTKTVSASCQIAKIFASDNIYSCEWLEEFQGQTAKRFTGNFSDLIVFQDESGRSYTRGACYLCTTLFIINGVFKFSIRMDPGITVHVATLNAGPADDITVSGPSFVTATVDGTPGSLETTTAGARAATTTAAGSESTSERSRTSERTTPRRTLQSSQPATISGVSSTQGTSAITNDLTPIVAGTVAGSLGLIIIVLIVVFGILLLRKKSAGERKEANVAARNLPLPPLPRAAHASPVAVRAARTVPVAMRKNDTTADTLLSSASYYTEVINDQVERDGRRSGASSTEAKRVIGVGGRDVISGFYDRPTESPPTDPPDYQRLNEYLSLADDYLTPI